MEKELNIAAILKEKPTETKLWSPMLGDCIYCYNNTHPEEIIIAFTDKNGEEKEWTFSYSGRTISAPDTAEVCLFPSKYMRDWSKFAWKKGDVLVSNDGKREVLFKTWENDSYTKFVGLHCLIINDNEEVEYDNGTTVFNTNDFKGIEAENVAQTYINTIEERLGGKLNNETLEAIPLKDGDIYFCKTYRAIKIGIFKSLYEEHNEVYISNYVYYRANADTPYLNYSNDDWVDGGIYRHATEEESKQLFDALAKEGKRWNPDTKQIEDLPKKCEFKPFEKVLARNSDAETWIATLFGFYDKEFENYICIGDVFEQCIPYNEETKHLLGTTDKWKGGEG